MKKLLLLMAVICVMLLPAAPAAAVVIDLIQPFDTYDDDIIKFGDGYSSIPADLDHYNQSLVQGTFSLSSVASDNAFNITTSSEGVQTTPYFTINLNPTILYLNTDESSLLFSDFFQVGQNTINFYVPTLSGSNLDDFDITQFDLSYNEKTEDSGQTDGAPVPEPATMVMFGLGLAGLAARRKK